MFPTLIRAAAPNNKSPPPLFPSPEKFRIIPYCLDPTRDEIGEDALLSRLWLDLSIGLFRSLPNLLDFGPAVQRFCWYGKITDPLTHIIRFNNVRKGNDRMFSDDNDDMGYSRMRRTVMITIVEDGRSMTFFFFRKISNCEKNNTKNDGKDVTIRDQSYKHIFKFASLHCIFLNLQSGKTPRLFITRTSTYSTLFLFMYMVVQFTHPLQI